MYLASHHLRLLQYPSRFHSLNPLLYLMRRRRLPLLYLGSLTVSPMHPLHSLQRRRYLESPVVSLMHQSRRQLPLYSGTPAVSLERQGLSYPPSLYLVNLPELKLRNRLLPPSLRNLLVSLMYPRRSRPHRQYLGTQVVSLKHLSQLQHPLYLGIPTINPEHRWRPSQSLRSRSILEIITYPLLHQTPTLSTSLKRLQQVPQIIFSVLDRLPPPQVRMHLDSRQKSQLRRTKNKLCMSIIPHFSSCDYAFGCPPQVSMYGVV